MQNAEQLQYDLNQFTGTENWYRHSLNPNFMYTDGVKFFAENAGGGAYWLLDIAATELAEINKTEEFIHLQVFVSADSTALLTADDGNDHELWTRQIEWTDCPIGTWRFYIESGVMLLPSEH